MNDQVKAFQISFLVHGVVIALVVLSSAFLGQCKKTIILDFNLLHSAPAFKKVESSAPFAVRPVKPAGRPGIKKKDAPTRIKEVHQISPVAETPPMVTLQEAGHIESSPAGTVMEGQGKISKDSAPGIAGGTKEGDPAKAGTGNANNDNESARTSYLNEHFAYIRNKILRNVIYPDAARRMGWQGKVILSFVIRADGSVRSFRIIQSSGFMMLDRKAVETVQEAAPFPRPPVEAQLVIPIIYRLD